MRPSLIDTNFEVSGRSLTMADLRPRQPVALTLSQAIALARRYHQAGALARTAPIYRQILKADPRRADVLYWLGAACIGLGKPDEGLTLLQQSLQLNPNQGEAPNLIGVVLANQGKLQE